MPASRILFYKKILHRCKMIYIPIILHSIVLKSKVLKINPNNFAIGGWAIWLLMQGQSSVLRKFTWGSHNWSPPSRPSYPLFFSNNDHLPSQSGSLCSLALILTLVFTTVFSMSWKGLRNPLFEVLEFVAGIGELGLFLHIKVDNASLI